MPYIIEASRGTHEEPIVIRQKVVIACAAGDRHISYLPLAHIYERNTLTTAIRGGVSVGFYRGNILELLDDVAELKPTVFTSVPRLYNRIYDKARVC